MLEAWADDPPELVLVMAPTTASRMGRHGSVVASEDAHDWK
jgi:hypothetical protein